MLENAVYQKPAFEKVASHEMPKDITRWNEEIIKKFFDDVPFLPVHAGVNVVINHLDENKGYAKGSVVVTANNKQVNYPIIVHNFNLGPFDVIYVKQGDDIVCFNSTKENINKALMSDMLGNLENMHSDASGQIKTPGDVVPKTSTYFSSGDLSTTTPLAKMSAWRETVRKEDLDKLAFQLEAEPNVRNSFVETTGDLISSIVNLPDGDRRVPNNHNFNKLDISDVVEAKRAVVAIDSEITDVNNMTPLKAPCACELRTYVYPTMDDFMDSGASAVSRLNASKVGNAVVGVLLTFKDIQDHDCCVSSHYNDKDAAVKNMIEQKDQIFIGMNGQYKIKNDYDKTGVLFYGSAVMNDKDLIGKMLAKIKDGNPDDAFMSSDADKSDKPFPINMKVNRDLYRSQNVYKESSSVFDQRQKSILVIYGADGMWECVRFYNPVKSYVVDGRKIYVGKDWAVIPANVVSIQKVGAVDALTQPAYKMVLNEIKDIYMIPETSIVLNTLFMDNIKDVDLMAPAKPIQQMYRDKAISEVRVSLGQSGIKIEGEPSNAIKKIAGIKADHEMGGREAQGLLKVMGVDEDRSAQIIKVAMDRGSVSVFGVRSDYVKSNPMDKMEKTAAAKTAFAKIAAMLKTNLVKEASVIEDPEAVDAVLSLNFINEDNLETFVAAIPNLEKAISKLCELLVAIRMGLSMVDDGAVKKAIDSMERVVQGLKKVKLALGK